MKIFIRLLMLAAMLCAPLLMASEIGQDDISDVLKEADMLKFSSLSPAWKEAAKKFQTTATLEDVQARQNNLCNHIDTKLEEIYTDVRSTFVDTHQYNGVIDLSGKDVLEQYASNPEEFVSRLVPSQDVLQMVLAGEILQTKQESVTELNKKKSTVTANCRYLTLQLQNNASTAAEEIQTVAVNSSEQMMSKEELRAARLAGFATAKQKSVAQAEKPVVVLDRVSDSSTSQMSRKEELRAASKSDEKAQDNQNVSSKEDVKTTEQDSLQEQQPEQIAEKTTEVVDLTELNAQVVDLTELNAQAVDLKKPKAQKKPQNTIIELLGGSQDVKEDVKNGEDRLQSQPENSMAIVWALGATGVIAIAAVTIYAVWYDIVYGDEQPKIKPDSSLDQAEIIQEDDKHIVLCDDDVINEAESTEEK